MCATKIACAIIVHIYIIHVCAQTLMVKCKLSKCVSCILISYSWVHGHFEKLDIGFVFSRTSLRLSRRSLTRSTTRRGTALWAATSVPTWRTRRATSSTSTSARSPSSCSRAARRYIPLALNFVLLAAAVLSGLQSRPPPELSEAGRAPSPQRALPGAAPAAGAATRRGRHSRCIYGVSECVRECDRQLWHEPLHPFD